MIIEPWREFAMRQGDRDDAALMASLIRNKQTDADGDDRDMSDPYERATWRNWLAFQGLTVSEVSEFLYGDPTLPPPDTELPRDRRFPGKPKLSDEPWYAPR